MVRGSARGSENQQGGSESQPGGSEGQREGSEGQPRGGRTNERTNERTDGRKISPFYRTSSPIGAAAQKGGRGVDNKEAGNDRTMWG